MLIQKLSNYFKGNIHAVLWLLNSAVLMNLLYVWANVCYHYTVLSLVPGFVACIFIIACSSLISSPVKSSSVGKNVRVCLSLV